MNFLLPTARLDIVESLRARRFMLYSLLFGGIVALLFAFGLTESREFGIGMLTSTLARSTAVVQGAAFIVWLGMLLYPLATACLGRLTERPGTRLLNAGIMAGVGACRTHGRYRFR